MANRKVFELPPGDYTHVTESGESWTIDIGPTGSASANSSLRLILEYGGEDDAKIAQDDALQIEKLNDSDLRALGAALASADPNIPYKSRPETLRVLVSDIARDRAIHKELAQRKSDRQEDRQERNFQFHLTSAIAAVGAATAIAIAIFK
jgi:hypothetical protein